MKGILKGVETRKMRLLNRNIIQQTYVTTLQCKFCNSLSVVRYGLTEKGKQRFKCQKCKRTFVTTDAPEKAHYSYDVIASALNLFYESASLAKVQRQLQSSYGVKPDRSTIYHWIVRYSKKATKALSNVPIRTGSKWIADETMIRLKEKDGTQIIERFHGILKDRTKVLRSFMRKGTVRIFTDGWLVHYNFFRPHPAVGDKTPAEAAGANAPFKSWTDVVKGESKGKTC